MSHQGSCGWCKTIVHPEARVCTGCGADYRCKGITISAVIGIIFGLSVIGSAMGTLSSSFIVGLFFIGVGIAIFVYTYKSTRKMDWYRVRN